MKKILSGKAPIVVLVLGLGVTGLGLIFQLDALTRVGLSVFVVGVVLLLVDILRACAGR